MIAVERSLSAVWLVVGGGGYYVLYRAVRAVHDAAARRRASLDAPFEAMRRRSPRFEGLYPRNPFTVADIRDRIRQDRCEFHDWEREELA